MASISTAIDPGRVSAISGYEIKKLASGQESGFAPQSIVILAQKAAAFEAVTTAQLDFTNASEVGDLYGFNGQAYAMARIIRPKSGNPLGSIRTIVIPVAEAVGATARVITATVTGTATKTTTHKLTVCGRTQLDGQSYSYVVAKDDTPTIIAGKMKDAVNNVLGCPVIGTSNVGDAIFTAGWKGDSSNEITVTVDTGDETAGITYSYGIVDGAGDVSIASALALFGSEWNTLVLNGFGSNSDILDALEDFNGNPNTKTGRYEPSLFKPFVAFFGDNSLTTLAGITAVTDARKDECTNVHCPAPNSLGMSFEAAANMAVLYAPYAQGIPHKDPIGLTYPDMPVADTIGDYADPAKRNQIVKIGGSTVIKNASGYEVVDFVTTYHPINESQTSMLFRWVRDIVGLDWNYKYVYTFLENLYVRGRTIIDDGAIVTTTDVISPLGFKSILINRMATTLVDNALMTDAQAFADSLQVKRGDSNRNRLETTFDCERTGVARVLSTTNNTK